MAKYETPEALCLHGNRVSLMEGSKGMKGVDLYVVKEQLEHSSIEMTERYAHLAPSTRKEAVARLDV
jgi:integrase